VLRILNQIIGGFDEIFRTQGFKVLKTPTRTRVADALTPG
jgi:hypothetical protein